MSNNIKQPSSYTTFVLCIGYCEESRLGSLILSRVGSGESEKETPEEAWAVNFSSIQQILIKAAAPVLALCCANTRKTFPTFSHCPECGRDIADDGADNYDDLCNFLHTLADSTLDSSAHYREFHDDLECEGWYFGMPQTGILTVVDNAELTLWKTPQEAYGKCERTSTEEMA